ncbi:MAG: hypothetical protein AAGI44_20690 [Pseudomonadota bacterium]
MGNNDIDRLRSAAEGLVLQDAQKHILAHRLAGKLSRKGVGSISPKDLLTLIDESMWDMNASVEVLEISEESYR